MKANGLPELTSFYEISSAGKHLHEKRIEVVGFLSVIKFDNTSLTYLCSNQDRNLTKAVITGSAVASATVSEFGVEGLVNINKDQIDERIEHIKYLMKD